jgi:hypothetical protein
VNSVDTTPQRGFNYSSEGSMDRGKSCAGNCGYLARVILNWRWDISFYLRRQKSELAMKSRQSTTKLSSRPVINLASFSFQRNCSGG